jgi:hypothetical protein
MIRINNRLKNLLERKREQSLPEVEQVMKHEAAWSLANRPAKPTRFSYRQRCYWFQPTKFMGGLNKKMFRAQKHGKPNTFNSLKTEFLSKAPQV